MKSKIIKSVQGFLNAIHRLYNVFADYDIPKSDYKIINDMVVFKKIGCSISPKDLLQNKLILQNHSILCTLKSGFADFKIECKGNYYEFTIDGISLNITSSEEILIVSEVFLFKHYNIESVGDSLLIDIGFNVGLTSLFFAKKKNIKQIYGFELFKKTYECGIRNLSLNEVLSNKIEVFNYGLSDRDYDDTLQYLQDQKGRMGINGLSKIGYEHDASLEKVYFKSIGPQFKKIALLYPNHFKICKMDCEGSEYKLIESLSEQGLLGLADYYIIEWHYISPSILIQSFNDSGFVVMQSTAPDLISGLLICTKHGIR